MKFSGRYIGFKISRSLMFGFAAVAVVSLGMVIWNLIHYKSVVANSCSEAVSNPQGMFQPASCDGILSFSSPVIIFFFLFIVSVILSIAAYFFAEYMEDSYGLFDWEGFGLISIAFSFITGIIFAFVVAFPFGSYESSVEKDRNAEVFKEWSMDRYGLEFSDAKAQKLYSDRMNSQDSSVLKSKSVKNKDGKFIVLVKAGDNKYQIVYPDTLDELPLTDAAKK